MAVELQLLPEPDGPTRRAVAAALAHSPMAAASPGEAYASHWRLAGLAESVAADLFDDEGRGLRSYGCSPRSSRGVTRA